MIFKSAAIKFTLLSIIVFFTGCMKEQDTTDLSFIGTTENVFIIVIDGPRFSETWDYPMNALIPFRYSIRNDGVFFNRFYNAGATQTTAGHTAITTGNYQNINNSGLETPASRNIFQLFRKYKNADSLSCWIITSKDKLQVLANTTEDGWEDLFLPSTDCGLNGLFSGYRDDELTLQKAMQIVENFKPRLMLLQFKEPDAAGHSGNFGNYLSEIRHTDSLTGIFFRYIENNPAYRNNTTIFITNDHGRHTDAFGGFQNHGDNCEGCRKIELLAFGPDFKKGLALSDSISQADLSATIAYLLNLPYAQMQGEPIRNLFKAIY